MSLIARFTMDTEKEYGLHNTKRIIHRPTKACEKNTGSTSVIARFTI